MSLKVIDPWKELVALIEEKLKTGKFFPEPLTNPEDEEEWMTEEFLEEEEWVYHMDTLASATDAIEHLVSIAQKRPHLAHNIVEVVAQVVPAASSDEEEENEIWELLQGFLNDGAIREVAKSLIVGWSLSGVKELRDKAREMRDHFSEDLREEITRKRIEQIRARAEEIEAMLDTMHEDGDAHGDEVVQGLYNSPQKLDSMIRW